MELAKLPSRVSGLLAVLVCLWDLLRRLRGQPTSYEAWEGGQEAEAPAAAAAKEGGEQAEAPVEAQKESMQADKQQPTATAAETPAGSEPEPAPEEASKAATSPPAQPAAVSPAAAPAAQAAPRPGASPPPEAEAKKIRENSVLADRVRAAITLHGRVRESLDVRGAVKTSFVPHYSPDYIKKGPELVLPRTQVLALFGAVQVFGFLCLLGAVALGSGASLGLLAMCVLVGVAAVAVLMQADRPVGGSPPAEALHAWAALRHEAAKAFWRSVVSWSQAAPVGRQRSVAWRNGLAFLVEAESKDSAEYVAFVIEANPVVVHHYVVRPGTTASGAPEVAWGLRSFLGGDDVIADDVPSNTCCCPSSVAPRKYSTVKVVLSTKSSPTKLVETATLQLKEGVAGLSQEPCVFVSPNNRMPKQWLGFGGSFTEAAADVFDKMTPEHQEEVLQAYFNPETGAGFTIGRIHMGSCDFALGNWACGDLKEGDAKLTDFSIEHYHEKILPMYTRAAKIAGTPLWMLASPWSPPPWMKTKLQWNGDAHLRRECGQVWADHYVRFVQEMAKAGVRIMAVTVQNEPEAAQIWESCIYTAEEERDFVRDYLGPTLWANGLSSVKVLIWDHNRDGMFERAQIAYADPEAAKYIWGCAYHWYGDARFEAWPDRHESGFADRQRDWTPLYEIKARLGFENLRRVAELAPDKHILFTEGCQELSGIPLTAIQNEWKFGERYAMNIISDMNSGVEGWIDWNLFLNEKGGPNHVDNNCLAPVIYNTEEKKVLFAPPYYAMSHFSRYIRPGARRVLCSTSRDVLEITAWANADDSIAVVILNQSTSQVDFKLKVGGSGTDPVLAVPVQSPAFSMLTLLIE